MKAMIFAAGLGTRLKPITDTKPKALVEINNTPILKIIILKLIKVGITDIIINTFHYHEQIEDFLSDYENFDINIKLSHEEQLLDTGGGLLRVADFFNDGKPFLVHNVDVITDINIKDMLNQHLQSDAIATIAVRERKTKRYFIFDNENTLCGWYSTDDGIKLSRQFSGTGKTLSFMGVHIISPEIFNHINLKNKFSITEAYLSLASNGHKIKAYVDNSSFWLDVGNHETLQKAQYIFRNSQF